MSSSALPLNKIGIIAKHEIADHKMGSIQKIISFLQKMKKDVYLDENIVTTLQTKKSFQHKPYTRTQLLQICDLIVVLGGDGTILKTASHRQKITTSKTQQSIPLILGVNFGNLGFLTESSPQAIISDLRKIFKNGYKVDERFLLHVTHYRNGKLMNTHEGKRVTQKPATFLALNDAVINQGSFARLIKMEIQINRHKVITFKGDGLIVSSPTGSTGHSLSAGGPIVHPALPAFILTPICPATLSIRPIVIPNDREIKITLTSQRREKQNVGLTIDGQHTLPLQYGDEIIIRKSFRPFYMVRIKNGKNYYQMLRSKLHWGEHYGG